MELSIIGKGEWVMELETLSSRVGECLLAKGLMVVTAESCTGGWVAQAITATAGCSRWFERGFITYSNTAKMELLGVQATTLECHGAVSEATVREMAEGALVRSHSQVAVAVSGVAGPGGGSLEKPVGTVCLAWAASDTATRSQRLQLHGNREAIRHQAVEAALQGILDILRDPI
jgi:nicotinamide-nucleotide amidase